MFVKGLFKGIETLPPTKKGFVVHQIKVLEDKMTYPRVISVGPDFVAPKKIDSEITVEVDCASWDATVKKFNRKNVRTYVITPKA